MSSDRRRRAKRAKEAARQRAADQARAERLSAYRADNPTPKVATTAAIREAVEREDAAFRHGRRNKAPDHNLADPIGKGKAPRCRAGWPERVGAAGPCVVVALPRDTSAPTVDAALATATGQLHTIRNVRVGTRRKVWKVKARP